MTQAEIPVIYQDHYLLIVNKPAGLVIHPTYKHADGTMWDSILAYLAEQGNDDWQPADLPDKPVWAGAPEHVQVMLREQQVMKEWKEEGLLPRPCLLHRLDKDTSGIVALARTERSRRHVIRQFHDHSIVKRYLAVVCKGAPEWAQPRVPLRMKFPYREGVGESDAPQEGFGEPDAHQMGMGEPDTHKEGFGELDANQKGVREPDVHKGRPYISAFPRPPIDRGTDQEILFSHVDLLSANGDTLLLDGPLQRDPDDRRRCIVGPDGQTAVTLVKTLVARGAYALLEARPITGRTHQIRAHLAAAGYAIVGDQTYTPPAQEGTPAAQLKRQFLHAYSLELKRYLDNERCTFVAPLADDLVVWLEAFFPEGLEAIDAGFTRHAISS